MMKETKAISQTLQIERELKKQGSIIWKCNGVSMLPFIKEKRDLVILETIKTEPEPYDVVMYSRKLKDTKEYVLHRLLYK